MAASAARGPLAAVVVVAVLVVATAVESKICYYVKWSPLVPEPLETIVMYTNCISGVCAKYQMKPPNITKFSLKVADCCPGYRGSAYPICLPECIRGCPPGKRCSAPNRCECPPGQTDSGDGRCVDETCHRTCRPGHCTDLGSCICDKGYTRVERCSAATCCVPQCAGGCARGSTCSAPGVCSRLPGNRRPARRDAGFHPEADARRGSRRRVPRCNPPCLAPMYCSAHNECACPRGYHEGAGSTCLPMCQFPCHAFQYCSAPDTCHCMDGYLLTGPGSLGFGCEPTCNGGKGCGHGAFCKEPDKCACLPDYREETDDPWSSLGGQVRCTPLCSSQRRNSVCVGRNTCQCLQGYQPLPEDHSNCSCNARCEPACVNANCSAPNSCRCWLGYEPSPQGRWRCEPICRPRCVNGDCVAPGQCRCWQGYRKGKRNKCERVCEDWCINGYCVPSGACECQKGYKPVEGPANRTLCLPSCEPPCTYGNCTAPNNCSCWEGYRETGDPARCEPDCPQGFLYGHENASALVCKAACPQGLCVEEEGEEKCLDDTSDWDCVCVTGTKPPRCRHSETIGTVASYGPGTVVVIFLFLVLLASGGIAVCWYRRIKGKTAAGNLQRRYMINFADHSRNSIHNHGAAMEDRPDHYTGAFYEDVGSRKDACGCNKPTGGKNAAAAQGALRGYVRGDGVDTIMSGPICAEVGAGRVDEKVDVVHCRRCSEVENNLLSQMTEKHLYDGKKSVAQMTENNIYDGSNDQKSVPHMTENDMYESIKDQKMVAQMIENDIYDGVNYQGKIHPSHQMVKNDLYAL